MTYISLILSEEAAPACVRELGSLGCIQFSDLNPEQTPFQRRYVSFIKRCDEIERKIRYVHGEVKKMNIPVQPAGSVDAFIERSLEAENGVSGSYVLESLESKLDIYEKQLLDLNKYSTKLTEEFSHKVSPFDEINMYIFFTLALRTTPPPKKNPPPHVPQQKNSTYNHNFRPGGVSSSFSQGPQIPRSPYRYIP